MSKKHRDGYLDFPLPDDICRCLDDTCDRRDTCLRYLDRNSGTVRCKRLRGEMPAHQCPCYYQQGDNK